MEEVLVRDDADRAGMRGRGRHEAENSIDEGPVAVEEGAASVDEVLQHVEDVREGSGVAREWSQSHRTAVLQLQPAVSSFIHEQACKVLRGLARVGSSRSGNGVGDAELRVAAACVTSHCDEGGLCAQGRHEANGVSEISPARKRACLCGVCGGEQFLTCNDRLLAGNVQ